MKKLNLFQIAALIICALAMASQAYAEDFVFKTILMKKVTETIPATSMTDCNGQVTTSPATSYETFKVMKTPDDFTKVSFKVFYSDNIAGTPIYSFLDKTPSQVNFNATTGEIAYTMTGIALSRKPLTAQVFLNNDGSGSPFEAKEFYTSQASNLPPVGSIIPYYGDYSANQTQLNLGGWFLCDGASIDAVDGNILYSDEKTTLKALVGGSNFPDLRGLFLRGVDIASHRDPGGARAVGNVQNDEFKSHTHPYSSVPANTEVASNFTSLNVTTTAVQSGGGSTVVTGVSVASDSHTHVINGGSGVSGAAGGSETRPINAAVNYLIKARK